MRVVERFAELLCLLVTITLINFISIASIQGQESNDVDGERLGIASEKPDSGPFVEIDGGRFMIPYTVTIPGSKVSFEMIPIPGGSFLMGSSEDVDDAHRVDEGPQVLVTMKPYWIGKHEVTWGEYYLYMKLDRVFKEFNDKAIRPVDDSNKADAVTAPSSLYDPSFTFMAGDDPEQPCATITQFAAKQYTKYLSLLLGNAFYRLPTEAEWEYACRAGTTTKYYFGDDDDELENHAWYYDNSDDERHPVGELEPNPWGLYDMYGNAAEWVLDGYSENGYAHLAEAETVEGNSILTKPKGVEGRVLRGGSFELEMEDCRSAARQKSRDADWKIEDPNFPKSPWWFTNEGALGAGFRLVRPLDVPAREEFTKFWDADDENIVLDYENRIRDNGRGAIGIVDPALPDTIKNKK
ncbi:MAG: formylglycine-generating enzyme family protein [Pirellulaceae bacterium]